MPPATLTRRHWQFLSCKHQRLKSDVFDFPQDFAALIVSAGYGQLQGVLRMGAERQRHALGLVHDKIYS